jgi:integrase
MHRDQLDFGARIWSIPAAGMKLGRARHVPMSDPAIEELKDMLSQQGIDVPCETNNAWTSQFWPRAAAKVSSRHGQHSD